MVVWYSRSRLVMFLFPRVLRMLTMSGACRQKPNDRGRVCYPTEWLALKSSVYDIVHLNLKRVYRSSLSNFFYKKNIKISERTGGLQTFLHWEKGAHAYILSLWQFLPSLLTFLFTRLNLVLLSPPSTYRLHYRMRIRAVTTNWPFTPRVSRACNYIQDSNNSTHPAHWPHNCIIKRNDPFSL